MDRPPYTSAEFHNDVQRQLISAVTAALTETKFTWAQVEAFLKAGRAVCRDDIVLNGRFAIHGVEQHGDEIAQSDEAYLSISARDRDDGEEWLSQTYWLSDIALADQDPDRVRSAVAGIERSLAKLNAWLAEREQPALPPAPDTLP